MVEMERTEWSDLRQESPNEIEDPDIQTVIRPTLLYGCETWPMSVKDERRTATTEIRMVRWAMGVSLLEHRRNEEILEEATVMRRRRLEWFGHIKRRDETENIRAVVEMKMEGKRPRGRPKLRWYDTVRRDMNAWSIGEEWTTDRERWKSLCRPATAHRETAAKGEKCTCVHALTILNELQNIWMRLHQRMS